MSELTANIKLFLPMLLAGVLVMSGVSVKNSGEKLWGQEMTLPGMILFVGGWILAGVAFGLQFPQSKNTLFIFLPILGIVATAMVMNNLMKQKADVPMILPIIFVISWLTFVGMISYESNDLSPFFAAGLVFYAMMYLLPMSRKACAADNLGMVYFITAWFILAANPAPSQLQLF